MWWASTIFVKLNTIDDIRSCICQNPLGQDPITKIHQQYIRFEYIIDEWHLFTRAFLQEELHDYSSLEDTSSCASSRAPVHKQKLKYVTMTIEKHKIQPKKKDPSLVCKIFYVPQLSESQLNLLSVVAKKKILSGEHAIAYAGWLGYDHGRFISGGAATAYIKKLQHAYLD